MADDKIFLAKKTEVQKVASDLSVLDNKAYDVIDTPYGTNLSEKFASEIASYSDPWQWIKARIKAKNYTGLHVDDFITFRTSDGLSFDAQIMGKYSDNYGDTAVGPHLDFCTRQVHPTNHVWNTANNNNGDANHHNPFLASELKAWMDNTIYPTLPAALRNVISPKRLYTPGRYSASGALTDDNEYMWNTFEKLWLPTEKEIIGCTNHGSMHFHEGEFQYPYFVYPENRNKVDTNGARRTWWVATSASGNSTHVCDLSAYGSLGGWVASGDWLSVPLCFRISGS